MSAVMSVVSAIFWGLVVLSLLVFIHEGGHYLAARAFGIRVTEFFLGMPSRWKLSHKSKARGTEIGVTPILLGGYTRICGMEGDQDELMGAALAIVQREGRVSASSLAEELGIDEQRAFDLLLALNDWASIRPFYDPEKGERPGQRDWPETFETLARDDRMLTEYDRGHDFSRPGSTGYGEPRPIEGDAGSFLAQERAHVYQGAGFLKRVVMLVAGPFVNVLCAFLIIVCALSVAGFDTAVDSNTIGEVEQGSLAEAAGLEEGDTITSIDGVDVSSWTDIAKLLPEKLQAGCDFQIVWTRDGEQQEATVDVEDSPGATALGIRAQIRHARLDPLASSAYALSYGGLVFTYSFRLIMPQHMAETVRSTSSIVGISAAASQAAASGPSDLVMLIAAISMSLGAMNLLPIPPLDGGKILLEVIELVRKKPLTMRVQTIVSYAGLAFFLVIFCFALRNDLTSIIGVG